MESKYVGNVPMRVEDGVLLPVLGVALVGGEQSTHIVDVNAVGLEDHTQLVDEVIQTSDRGHLLDVHRTVQ